MILYRPGTLERERERGFGFDFIPPTPSFTYALVSVRHTGTYTCTL